MYVLTDENNVIMHICKIKGYEENGNVLISENGEITAIPPHFINAQYEISEIPEGVTKQKYCYTQETGFYENENYKEIVTPEMEIENLKKENKILQEQITDLQLAMTEMYESGV